MIQTVTHERRRHQRIRTLMKGVISYNRGTITIPCVVRDISAGGARVRVEGGTVVPGTFDLLLPERNESFSCRLVRTNGDEIGLEFILPHADLPTERVVAQVVAPPMQPEPVVHHDDSALELEIAALKAQIAALEADNKRMKTMLTRLGIE